MARPRKTLQLILKKPTHGEISWRDIEALFENLGADVSGHAGGSSRRFSLNGQSEVFHRPHDGVAGRGRVDHVREFLFRAGIGA